MAADLHIHSMKGLVVADLARFFTHTMGSKYFDLNAPRSLDDGLKIMDSEGVWIGEVSWLKAGLFEGGEETFVPGPVARIHELIGEELPVLGEELAGQIIAALRSANVTQYRTAEEGQVEPWLVAHMGDQLFTVSW